MGFNPILRSEDMARSLRYRRETPKANTVLVLQTSANQLQLAKFPITAGMSLFGGYRRMYEVDTADHSAAIDLDLPSSDAFTFRAEVNLTWRVSDPVLIVQRNVEDCEALCVSQLRRDLVDVIREYEIEDYHNAEIAAKERMSRVPIEVAEVLTISKCIVHLHPDAAARQHLQRRRTADRDVESTTLETRVKVAQIRNDVDKQGAMSQLDLITQRHELEMERLRQKHDLEMKTDRMKYYSEALANGDEGILRLFLVERTDDVKGVMGLLMGQREKNLESATRVLELLVEGKYVTRSDVNSLLQQTQSQLAAGIASGPLGPPAKSAQPGLEASESADGTPESQTSVEVTSVPEKTDSDSDADPRDEEDDED